MEKVFDKVTDCHFKTTRHLNSCSFTKKVSSCERLQYIV